MAAATLFFPNPLAAVSRSPHLRATRALIVCKARESQKSSASDVSSSSSSALEIAAIAGTAVAVPVVCWSLYALKTTGCGLPPGPGGAIGALEGVSYLEIAGIIAWSIYTKVKTGSGLPSGPFGLLGAVEGLSYLTVLAIVLVFGLQFAEKGSLPGPLPGEQCFGG